MVLGKRKESRTTCYDANSVRHRLMNITKCSLWVLYDFGTREHGAKCHQHEFLGLSVQHEIPSVKMFDELCGDLVFCFYAMDDNTVWNQQATDNLAFIIKAPGSAQDDDASRRKFLYLLTQ